MIRIETTQGTLARRGFVDAEAAARVIEHWDDEHEPLLDVLAQSADPDQALAELDRLCERVPGLLSRLTAAPILARQLIMVLGASNRLAHHLIAHPEHIELLEKELVKIPAASLRQELLVATGADPESAVPIATDTMGDELRLAYRGALLRIAARDLCAPEPIEAVVDIADELSDLADATLEAALSISRLKLGENALKTRLAAVLMGCPLAFGCADGAPTPPATPETLATKNDEQPSPPADLLSRLRTTRHAPSLPRRSARPPARRRRPWPPPALRAARR